MSPKTKLSLLEIEQEVEAQAREWHRQQLQKRLQQVAEEQGAVCPLTGEPLQAACYEAVTWIPVRAPLPSVRTMAAIPRPGSGSIPSDCFGDSNPVKGSARSCRIG